MALKELRPEQTDDAVLRARFLREAQITGQLGIRHRPGLQLVADRMGRPFIRCAW
jgi:hypothetical protein